MAQIAGMELGRILEALRAVRDPEVNAQGAICGLRTLDSARLLNVLLYMLPHDWPSLHAGLQALRQGLQGPSATSLLAEVLAKSPDLKELRAVWDTQLTVPATSLCTARHPVPILFFHHCRLACLWSGLVIFSAYTGQE